MFNMFSKACLIVMIALVVLIGTSKADHIAGCTKNTDGTGDYAPYWTKECCRLEGESNINYYYNSGYGDCRSRIAADNGLNGTRFSKCCSNRSLGYYST